MDQMDQAKQEAMDGSPAYVGRWGAKYRDRRDPLVLPPPYIRIKFQCGPIQEVGVNGCAIEDVLDVLIERLQGFQRGLFACGENAAAIDLLGSAKGALLVRTAKRQTQGVEGTNAAHTSEPPQAR